MKKAVLTGKDFKTLIAKITKFPGLGMFGGSDLVSLFCEDGYLTASSFGVVLAVGKKPCNGALPLCAVDERVVQNFAGIVPESGKVSIEAFGKDILFKCGRNEVLVPAVEGRKYKAPESTGEKLRVTPEVATTIRYLADVAYDDASRAELCCVMLMKNGRACAMDQKAIAVLKTGLETSGNVPLPLPISRYLETGNILWVDEKITILKAGSVTYSMPSLIQATKMFPFGVVSTLRKSSGKVQGSVDGAKMAGAIEDCMKCLGQLSKTEATLELRLSASRLALAGTNGGARFDTSVPASAAAGTDQLFRVPLASIARLRSFMQGLVSVSTGEHGDLYLRMDAGWCMFPSEEAKA